MDQYELDWKGVFIFLCIKSRYMFQSLLEKENIRQDAPVVLSGFIHQAERISGNHRLLYLTKQHICHFSSENGSLRKSELLKLWKDEDIEFSCKILATILWGGLSHRLGRRVYSSNNFDNILSLENQIKNDFENLSHKDTFDDFVVGLKILFKNFEKGGIYHINGVGIAFFTKIFHFWFASHPLVSRPGFLPVIADKWMKLAVYAEMADNNDDSRFELFSVRNGNPDSIDFRRNQGNADDAYVRFILYFNDVANNLNDRHSDLTPFMLEDILFNESKAITPLYVSKDYPRIFLPPWIAGRYNNQEALAIIFNNLCGETYLFEGATAKLWQEILKYDYKVPFNLEELCSSLNCGLFDIASFFKELIEHNILSEHILTEIEEAKIRKSTNKTKSRFLRSRKGINNFHAAYESVDNEYINKTMQYHSPFSASIELTYACNEACIHCYNPHSPREGEMGIQKIIPKGEMTLTDYFALLDSMKQIGIAKIIFTGGDPFMKKDLMKILEYAHKLKFSITVYTNGQALYSNKAFYTGLKNLYPQYVGLSLYSTVPEIHDSITRRPGSCEKTKAVARKCYQDAISLQIKCPIMKANADTYHLVYDFAISVNGVPQFDVNITSSIDGDCYASQRLRLSEEQLSELLKDNRIPLSIENSVGVIERLPEMAFCGAGESAINIQPDGTVTPCCAFPISCGNVRETSLVEILRSSDKLAMIQNLRYGDSDICGKREYCKYCNRCIGQSYVEHGKPENHSEDNCFLAKIRYKLSKA